jgi:uncharacterized protein (DUF433 family)
VQIRGKWCQTEYMKCIIVDPDICNGKPIVEGTCIPVQTILEFLSAGDSIEEVLEEYPTLTHEDILQCLRFSKEIRAHS